MISPRPYVIDVDLLLCLPTAHTTMAMLFEELVPEALPGPSVLNVFLREKNLVASNYLPIGKCGLQCGSRKPYVIFGFEVHSGRNVSPFVF
jgi:hypothetical protein